MKTSRLAKPFLSAAAIVAAASFAPSAAAQAPVTPGTQVVDPAGNPVGTVTAVTGGDLILKTGRHEVRLPVTSFTPDEGKLLFAMTREELDAETDQALADAREKLVVGAAVHGNDGGLAGQIEEIDESTVTVKLASGELVRMPRSAIAPADHGAVLGVTVDELKTMASGDASQ